MTQQQGLCFPCVLQQQGDHGIASWCSTEAASPAAGWWGFLCQHRNVVYAAGSYYRRSIWDKHKQDFHSGKGTLTNSSRTQHSVVGSNWPDDKLRRVVSHKDADHKLNRSCPKHDGKAGGGMMALLPLAHLQEATTPIPVRPRCNTTCWTLIWCTQLWQTNEKGHISPVLLKTLQSYRAWGHSHRGLKWKTKLRWHY